MNQNQPENQSPAFFLPFFRPDISEEEIKAVTDVMRSGWLTTGANAAAFEKEFADYIKSKQSKLEEKQEEKLHAIAVNSATAGLHLALEAADIKAGDEVIVPSLTFTATAEVVRYLGAEVRFVDVDEKTLCINPEKIKSAITNKTKAIIPVHYGGLSCDINKISEIANQHNLKIIEDAAHALGTTFENNPIGLQNTSASVFSFYANKTMTTCGEGGMILTKDEKLASRMKKMRLHGIDRDAFSRFTAQKPAWFYEIIDAGYKYNLTDVAAAMGREQLKRLDKMAEKRNKLAKRYLEELKNLPLILPHHNEQSHSWHLFVIRLNKINKSRDEVINELFKAGIGTSVHYIPLHLQPYWKNRYNLQEKDFPVSQKAFENMITLPLFSGMTDDEQTKVIKALNKILC